MIAAAAPHTPVSQDAFRQAMSRLAAAVNIITTDGPAGRFGFTASAMCSVTDAPPTLLVCVNRKTSALEPLLANGVLCVNTLSPSQAELSRVFGAGGPMDARFAAAEWEAAATGAPRLKEAPISFDCRVENVAEQGTHKVLFCRVEEIVQAPIGGALVYFGRSYHGLHETGVSGGF